MQDICDEYFRSINLLAKLISTDIDETKDAYQDLWETLNAEEKCQALDDALIFPDAILKYSIYEDEDVTDSGFYHQHSWFTKSQQNLSSAINTQLNKPLGIIKSPIKKKELIKQSSVTYEPSNISNVESKEYQTKPIVESVSLLSKIKSKVYNKIPAADEEKELLFDSKTQISIVPKSSVLKPKNPPPPPPTAKSGLDVESSLLSSFESLNTATTNESTIPKTGFDFLDNW